ncbi:PLP-dependent aminotransferase family protein [Nioella aestuarii]|uniref:MocR-like pyridoxine biosynthesis transcription factor PdxR n=1 Tax=Nioella aestuarii TaxID=1662864 RepID=UPI003D7FBA40
MQTNLNAALLAISLDRSAPEPLHLQLTEALRHLILSGQALPGARLPASRQLAKDLSVSRQTALTALDQLVAEGYLDTRQGAGCFVASDLPHLAPPAPSLTPPPEPPVAYRPFQPGIPDMTLLPHATWARHLDRAWRHPNPDLLAMPNPLGWPALRAAIAAHLMAWRGIDCAPGQVVITSGATETFELLAQALLQTGDKVLVEQPGFAPMRAALLRAGLVPVSMDLDEDGAQLAVESNARAVVLTPSRHYPLGMTMPLPRRLAFLEWAARTSAWIIEDDYDSEFRYTGTPLPALMSLGTGQTIYVGSFSKLISPALRLAYMVLPPSLVEPIRQALAETGPRASLVPQPALAAFMDSGAFATHLRRMRRVYADRQKALLRSLSRHLPEDALIAEPDPSGMHLVCRLGPALATIRDTDISERAAKAGLTVRALSAYWPDGVGPTGLVLGYAAFSAEQLDGAVQRLAAVLHEGSAPVST